VQKLSDKKTGCLVSCPGNQVRTFLFTPPTATTAMLWRIAEKKVVLRVKRIVAEITPLYNM
jgi:hypothetical protein